MRIDRHVLPRSEPPIGHRKDADCPCKPVIVRIPEDVPDLAGQVRIFNIVVARHRALRSRHLPG